MKLDCLNLKIIIDSDIDDSSSSHVADSAVQPNSDDQPEIDESRLLQATPAKMTICKYRSCSLPFMYIKRFDLS